MKNRIRLIVSTLLLSLALCAAAETHYMPRLSVGGRAGISMGRMSFSPNVKQSFNRGTAGAVSFRYAEEKIFGLIAEFGWVQRGWKENYEGEPFSYSRTLTYLRMPFLTHINFGSRRFKGFVNLGPEVSYMIGDEIKSDFDYRNIGSVPDYPANRRTEQLSMDIKNKFDYGICAGLGMEFFVQPRHSVLLEARFYYGLGNIFPAAKADVFGASRNMSLELTLGYFFRIK